MRTFFSLLLFLHCCLMFSCKKNEETTNTTEDRRDIKLVLVTDVPFNRITIKSLQYNKTLVDNAEVKPGEAYPVNLPNGSYGFNYKVPVSLSIAKDEQIKMFINSDSKRKKLAVTLNSMTLNPYDESLTQESQFQTKTIVISDHRIWDK